VTSPSATQSDPWPSMQSQMHTQGAKTTAKQTSPGGTMTSGFRTDDQSRFCLSKLRLYITDLGWITLLIGAGVSGFTTRDVWFYLSSWCFFFQYKHRWQFDTS